VLVIAVHRSALQGSDTKGLQFVVICCCWDEGVPAGLVHISLA
jgi:hypothetical protein